jgi:hypothetical protein
VTSPCVEIIVDWLAVKVAILLGSVWSRSYNFILKEFQRVEKLKKE